MMVEPNQWQRWQSTPVDLPANSSVEVLFIDDKNQICKLTVKNSEFDWASLRVIAWRVIPAKRRVVGHVYWNWQNRKTWPVAALKPPHPKLGYIRVDFVVQPDGSVRPEYIPFDTML